MILKLAPLAVRLFQRVGRQQGRPTGTVFTAVRRKSDNYVKATPTGGITAGTIEPPHPDWKFGDGLPLKEAQWKEGLGQGRTTWDLQNSTPKETYQLLTSAIVPRPIAFVSSLSLEGLPNLAPFSYFSMVSHNPPMISISFNLSPRRPKDTRENILATKEFTVNIISEPIVDAANSTSVESPHDMNEWILSGLTMEPSMDVKPPFVKESAVSFECELYSYQDITPKASSDATATIVLGTIKRVHALNSVLTPGGNSVNPALLQPIARLGGTEYATIREVFNIARPSWKVVRQVYEALESEKEKNPKE
ncbi:hypothetical protein BD779DRAFT_1503694 [Infundibulicybe gibba]|nr:hypothetical protein BD779DRAFT_1503694 [Infundibulicybe gibba]